MIELFGARYWPDTASGNSFPGDFLFPSKMGSVVSEYLPF